MHFLYKYFGLFKNKNTGNTGVLSIARDRIPYLDRHLLYYRWNIHEPIKKWSERNIPDQTLGDIPHKIGPVGPILIKCQRHLPKVTATTDTTELVEVNVIPKSFMGKNGSLIDDDMEKAAHTQIQRFARKTNASKTAGTKIKPISQIVTQIIAAL